MVAYDLSQFRASIDAIDDQIINLLNERSQIVKKVGLTKGLHLKKGECFIRSGREADLLRRVYADFGNGTFPPHFATAIWRIIISASLSLEAELKVSVSGTEESLYWLAREYFGSFTPVTVRKKSVDAISDVVKNRAHVAILLAEGDNWWLHLPEDIRVFACVPFVLQKKESIKAFAVARLEPEKTMEDITLLRLKGDRASDKAWVRAVFNRHGFKAKLAATAKNAGLVEIKGFMNGQDKVIAGIKKETGADVKVIGVYATPIAV